MGDAVAIAGLLDETRNLLHLYVKPFYLISASYMWFRAIGGCARLYNKCNLCRVSFNEAYFIAQLFIRGGLRRQLQRGEREIRCVIGSQGPTITLLASCIAGDNKYIKLQAEGPVLLCSSTTSNVIMSNHGNIFSSFLQHSYSLTDLGKLVARNEY